MLVDRMEDWVLAKDEEAIVLCLGEIWNDFIALPKQAHHEEVEFMHLIHAAQNAILARVGFRCMGRIGDDDRAD